MPSTRYGSFFQNSNCKPDDLAKAITKVIPKYHQMSKSLLAGKVMNLFNAGGCTVWLPIGMAASAIFDELSNLTKWLLIDKYNIRPFDNAEMKTDFYIKPDIVVTTVLGNAAYKTTFSKDGTVNHVRMDFDTEYQALQQVKMWLAVDYF